MNNGLEIAIIGMAGRFPGAKNVAEFWHNLQRGVESISGYSLEELGVNQSTGDRSNFVNAGGQLEDIDLFAADFFGFNPREAELLDPQHRLFLETAWTALESAGYDGQNYPKAVGVFGGAGMNGYMFNLYRNAQIRDNTSKYQLFLASEKDFLTTRVSYKLSLEGSSVNIQTACSTSLVAVHMACQSLLSGECDMALAGGVAISLSKGYQYQEGGIYSPDGHCRAFAEDASGTVGGSGVGIVVLKRLEDAQSDRDRILAVVKGSAMNNDGETKVSYTAPRIDTQAKVIRAAQLVAEVSPDSISYIETHGTGTALGDPIEVAALTQAFRLETKEKQFCALASVKPNIGHLDAAAGIASLIKAVLALQHQQIPPSINCDRPNPQIDWSNSPFYVNRELVDWSSQGKLRRAGVSSFGIGGTNVHLILEEAFQESQEKSIRPNILVLSAKTKTALEEMTGNLARHLKDNPSLDLASVAYTLQVGRRAFEHRRMLVAATVAEAAESLSSLALDQVFTNQVVQEYKPVVFMFSGQGSQYQNMGWGLYQSQPVFKESCDRCFQILEPDLDISLKEILFPSASSTASTLQETQYSQLGIFVIEYALTQLWLTWGVVPEALIGHSIGEYVAATIAGVFSLSDALKIVATRAKLMQQQPPGVMLSVALSAAEMEEYLSEGVCLAVSNAPSLCAVSGEEQAIAKVETALQERGIAARRLKTSHGFHSHLMEQAIAPLTAAIREVNLNPPQIPFISNVTGTWITNEQATNPEYWGQHLRQTVRFAEGIAEIVQEPKRILLEVGAGKTLSTLAQQTSKQQVVISSLRHPKDTQEDLSLILRTCGQLWLAGVKIDWEQLHEVQPYRVALPTYPFERQRYWIEPDLAEFNLPLASKPQTDGDRWFYIPTWSKVLPLAKIDSSKLLQACWLIMEAEPGLEKSLNEYLIAAEQQVINVSQGEDFQVLSDSQIVCNQEHYEQLLAHLNEQNLITQHTLQIIYFQGNFEDANFSNLLNLVKILDKQRLECSIQLNIITQQLHDIIGTENVQIKHSSISGITKVLSQEYPQINCRVIDTDTSQTRVDYLLPEILTSDNLSIAYRGDRRWQQTYQNLTLDSSKTRLKQGGVYLIFGSISKGLGLVWAQYLQEKFQAKLALVGDVEETEGQIDFDNHDYSLIQADINSQADVSKAIATAEEARGKIDGVFYATPMTNQNSASLITELNSSHWEYNYQTKIKPLHVLAACLKDRELDFILLQSSLSSILGGLGLAAYAGANCYLDAFAEEQNNNFDNHTPWFSVNWDAYQTETASQNLSGIGASLSEYSLTPQEVGTATEEILSLPSGSQVIVSKGDLTARIERWLNSTLEEQQAANNISNIQPHARPNLTTEYIPPSNETEKAIAEIWQQVLGIDQVGVNDSFFELGGHSLLAIQTISRIREQFSVELPMSSILADTPTVANLATMIEKQQPQAEELATIEQLLTEVQNMSPEEIAAQLEERNNL